MGPACSRRAPSRRPGLPPGGAELGVEDVAAQRDALVAQRDAAAAEQLLDLVLELAAPRARAGHARPLAAGLGGLEQLARHAELAGRVDREPAAQRQVTRAAHHHELAAVERCGADRALHGPQRSPGAAATPARDSPSRTRGQRSRGIVITIWVPLPTSLVTSMWPWCSAM